MNCKIVPSRNLLRKSKRLRKRYPSLKEELTELEKSLLLNPRMGTSLGLQCYKIRLAVKSKGKGKSGGLRVITWVIAELQKISDDVTEVILATVYDSTLCETSN